MALPREVNGTSSAEHHLGALARLAARNNDHDSPTANLAPKHLQANLIALPSRYAEDFRILCARNPVPCPLLAESKHAGCWDEINSYLTAKLIREDEIFGGKKALDIRRDIPRYMVYKDSQLTESHCVDIVDEWTDDHVAFLIGCSFSFESELSAAGLAPRHVLTKRNVPMYRTNIPLCPAGVFTGSTYVVSMRPYQSSQIDQVRSITRRFGSTHGEPVDWGWDAVARLGIKDLDKPDWGDRALTPDGKALGEVWGLEDDVPVFWGCGVTPQEAVVRAGVEGTVMAHAPGHLLVLDCKDCEVSTGS